MTERKDDESRDYSGWQFQIILPSSLTRTEQSMRKGLLYTHMVLNGKVRKDVFFKKLINSGLKQVLPSRTKKTPRNHEILREL